MTKRLSKADWLDHGLKMLARSGSNALRAEPLAKSLNVSRGSFYWHFRDISDFHAELLAHWRARSTDIIIADVDQSSGGKDKLRVLMRKAMLSDDRLERAIRSWATQNPTVAKAVDLVDGVRLAYLADILRAVGVCEQTAQARAAFIYWASLGRIMMDAGSSSIELQELDAIADLLQS